MLSDLERCRRKVDAAMHGFNRHGTERYRVSLVAALREYEKVLVSIRKRVGK